MDRYDPNGYTNRQAVLKAIRNAAESRQANEKAFVDPKLQKPKKRRKSKPRAL